MQTKTEHRTASSKIISDEQRQTHEWAVLVRKLRGIGLNDAANRLAATLLVCQSRNRNTITLDHSGH